MKSFEENADIIAVKGSFETRQTKLISRFAQIEYLDKYDKLKKEAYIDFVGTDSAGYRREVFLQAGGFDTVFPQASAEDVELSYRLANQGYKIVFNPRAKVYHLHAESLMDYWKKKYKFAYWRIVAVKKHPNKIWKDSHTPQSMKIQLLLTPLLLTSVAALPLSAGLAKVTFLLFLLTYLSTTGFILKAVARDTVIGLLSPFFILLRSSAQFFGVTNGIIDNLHSSKAVVSVK
jgi:GT2 family glycosyltransferase